jgi:hypothetical protein
MSDHDARLSDEQIAALLAWCHDRVRDRAFAATQNAFADMRELFRRDMARGEEVIVALRELQQRRAAGEPVEGRPSPAPGTVDVAARIRELVDIYDGLLPSEKITKGTFAALCIQAMREALTRVQGGKERV